jgi:hypothetical protein
VLAQPSRSIDRARPVLKFNQSQAGGHVGAAAVGPVGSNEVKKTRLVLLTIRECVRMFVSE